MEKFPTCPSETPETPEEPLEREDLNIDELLTLLPEEGSVEAANRKH